MRPPSLTERRENDPDFLLTLRSVDDSLHRSSWPNLLDKLSDTRPIHKKLFQRYQEDWSMDAAGNYRGSAGTCVANWNIGGDPNKPADTTSAFENVEKDMSDLELVIRRLDTRECSDRYFRKVVFIFQRFQVIHPYYDGNGHIDRLILANLMVRHPHISESPRFRIHPHPFSTALRICVNNYRSNPEILESYFLNWFCHH